MFQLVVHTYSDPKNSYVFEEVITFDYDDKFFVITDRDRNSAMFALADVMSVEVNRDVAYVDEVLN